MALELLFCDGFDIVDADKSTLKYAVSISFLQARILAGQNSVGALSIDNTAGTTAQFIRSLPATPILLWNAHFQVNPSSSQTFLILEGSGGPLLQLKANTGGTLDLLDGSGSVLASTPAISFSTTYWLEVNASYGVSAEIEVWLGLAGSTPTRVIHLTGVNLGSAMPDEFTFQWKSSGAPNSLWLDNISVWAAGALSDRNGPSCVTGEIVGTLAQSGAWPVGAGSSILEAVADRFSVGYLNVPDGTASYIITGSGDVLFNSGSSPCFGLVLAAALNLCAAPTDPTPTITGILKDRTLTQNLGTVTVVDTTNTLVPGTPALFGFATYQMIAMNPPAGGIWNDSQIVNDRWGAAASGLLKLTQVYVEKVTDLTGRKFGCGESSYAF